jgi:hypothetical protein
MSFREYSRPSVSGSGCTYSSLQNYNQNYASTQTPGAPVVASARSNEIVIIPSYGGIGYSSLNASADGSTPSCTGYSRARNAYPTEGCNLYLAGNQE